jgi:hypothetical protein
LSKLFGVDFGHFVEGTSAAPDVPVPDPFDADYRAVLDYATAQGFTLPSAAQQEKENDRVVQAKATGDWVSSFVWYNCATDGDVDFACINYKNPGTFPLLRINSPVFVPLEGFYGNGSTARVEIELNPSTLSFGAFGQNNACIWHYGTFPESAAQSILGFSTFGTSFGGRIRHNPSVWRFGINNTGTGAGFQGNPSGALGLSMMSRGSSSEFFIYRVDEGGVESNTSAPTPNTPTLVFINTGSTGRFVAGGVGVHMQAIAQSMKDNIDFYLSEI